MESEQPEVAKHDAEQQLAEHGGKTDALRQRREQARGHQDDRKPEQVLAHDTGTGGEGGR